MSTQPEDTRCPFPGCVVPLPHSHGTEVDAALTREQANTPSTREALKRLNSLQPEDGQGRTYGYARGGFVEAPQPETMYVDQPGVHEVLHACSMCGKIHRTMDEATACYLSHPQCGHPSENGPEACEEPFGHAGPHGYTRGAPTVNVEPLSSLSDRLTMAETISTGPPDDPRSIVIRAQPTAEETVEIMARDLYEITQSGMAQDYPWASRPKRQQEDYRSAAREFMKRGWSRS